MVALSNYSQETIAGKAKDGTFFILFACDHIIVSVQLQFFIFKVNFLVRKIFCGNLNEAISSTEIASFTFPRKIFLGSKLLYN